MNFKDKRMAYLGMAEGKDSGDPFGQGLTLTEDNKWAYYVSYYLKSRLQFVHMLVYL